MSRFRFIRDVLARDLSKPIEEVIKLSQTDEDVVYTELTEYVVTDNIRQYYSQLLKAINESITNPTEGIGVWVSGFFGSGKSSFVKNLGYILANPTVRGQAAAELFIQQVKESAPKDTVLSNLIRNLTARVPFEVIMFDVSAVRAVQKESERLAEIMYRVLLDHLDYTAQRYEIAELEIELEGEGRLGEFIRTVATMLQADSTSPRRAPGPLPVTIQDQVSSEEYAIWRATRSGALAYQRASAALHRMDPATFSTPDAWANIIRDRGVDITVELLVERTFDLTARRRPGRAVFYIIDEVGQYVARSGDKILDLQAIARELGPAGRNRVARGQAPAPAWLVVTSQEKLGEIVDAIGEHRVELAKLQDSFRHHIDLGPQDIREVAARRVLAKKPEAVPTLESLYEQYRGTLNAHCELEQTSRFQPIEQAAFVEAYPYLPHHIDLSIDIMSALRTQPGAPRHLGGSNRTIIKQAYEMLVNDRTRLADQPLGTLVTVDKIYELVEHNLSHEKQKDIADIDKAFGQDSWEARVARALALLEPVRYLPRTPRNIAALLYTSLGDDLRLQEVETALANLEDERFVRLTEDGWKLLTRAEKAWEEERRELAPTPSQELEILRESARRLWEDPNLRAVHVEGARAFSVAVTFEGRPVQSRGHIPLHLVMADDEENLQSRLSQGRQDSRSSDHQNDVYWLFTRTQKLEEAAVEYYRSQAMVQKYEQTKAQGRLSEEQIGNLNNELRLRERWISELDRQLQAALARGIGLFRGVEYPASSLVGGRLEWREVLRAFLSQVVPQLYEKLYMANVRLPKDATCKALSVRDLGDLPPVFHEGDDALGLVVYREGRFIANPEAPAAEEILAYIRREQEYGNSVTGKKLEEHFGDPPYGWPLGFIQAVLAVLLRAGLVELLHQSRRLHSATDPYVRRVFSGSRDFRAATFRLRTQIDLRTIVAAAKTLETIRGFEVNPEELAVYEAAREWATETLEDVRLRRERAQAYKLVALDRSLENIQERLEEILNGDAETIVLTLAEQSQDLRLAVESYRHLKQALDPEALDIIRRVRFVLERMWPELKQSDGLRDGLAEEVEEARRWLETPDLAQHLGELNRLAEEIANAYQELYEDLHLRRGDAYQRALEEVQTWPEWEVVSVDVREQIIRPLVQRACATMDFDSNGLVCRHCQASPSAMSSDIWAVDRLLEQVHERLREAVPPPEEGEETPPVVRIALHELVRPQRTLRSPEDVEHLVDQIRQALLSHIEEGRVVELE